VNIDGAYHVVGQSRAGLVAGIFPFLAQKRFDLVRFAVDIGLRRRGADCIGNHAAHIGKRGLPVAQGNDRCHRDVGTAADILLFNRRDQIAAAAARAVFQPPVDQRLRDEFQIEPSRVFDRVDPLFPWAHHGQRQGERLVRFDDLARRRRLRIGFAEIGVGGIRPIGAPVAVIFRDQPGKFRGIRIADDNHDCTIGAVPALVKGRDRRCTCLAQRSGGADGRAVAEQLARKQMRVRLIAYPLLRTVRFA